MNRIPQHLIYMDPFCNSTISSPFKSLKPIFNLLLFIFFLIPSANAVTFSYSSFQYNDPNINYTADALPVDGVMQLTRNVANRKLENSVGRATYNKPIPLWDPDTNKLTDFTTDFSFNIEATNRFWSADGFAFFLAPVDSGTKIPDNSAGGSLSLFSFNESTYYTRDNGTVAVEFDTFLNDNVLDPSSDHVGIDINSIVSVASKTLPNKTFISGGPANALISYNGTTSILNVVLTYSNNSVFNGSLNLSHEVDLRKVLPQQVLVGFSAATGSAIEFHNILSWNFSSSLELRPDVGGISKWVVGLIVCLGVVICGLGLIWLIMWRKRKIRRKEEEMGFDEEIRRKEDEEMGFDEELDDDFQRGTGPKRFTYRELISATNNFSEEGKLGQGGFGGVYKGFLNDLNLAVAVKRVSEGSKQGKKEYASEVKIISRLRHRNLVQLIGWSHNQGQFFLVYELMPNGSLDFHLFGKRSPLPWPVRYKIALGLASALFYLHEEWEQCVVHRDIKSSNVMLDSGFNAKLGDFGLARLVDHDSGSQTTVLAGTMGYMAPECVITGKASKETDVFSFGVVVLEIVCGRRSVEPKAEVSEIRLVNWVWEFYGRGRLLDVADKSLNMDFDEKELQALLVVGLWCAHPDYNSRPTIRHAIQVLNFEAPLPDLPARMPVPVYSSPPMHDHIFSYTVSSSSVMDSSYTPSSKSTATTDSSPSVSLLHHK